MSTASTLAQAIFDQLSTILTDNGYATDIGATGFRGRTTIDEDKLPCFVLVEGDDKVLDEASRSAHPATLKPAPMILSQRYIVEGHMVCDPDHPNDTAHLILADLKKAIFSGDRTFGKIVRKIKYSGRAIGRREDGLALIAASIIFDAEFVEDLTAP